MAQTTYIENSQVAELQEVFDISRPYYLQIRNDIANEYLKQGGNLYL